MTGPNSGNCCASPVTLGQKSSLLLSTCWDHPAEGRWQTSLRVAWWYVWDASSGEAERNYGQTTQITHPTESRLVFQTVSQLGKTLGLLGFGNRSPLFIDQAIVASAFLRLTCQHVSLSSATFRAQWSTSSTAFSVSWRRLPAKMPVSASWNTIAKLNKANMDSHYVSAEEDCQC